MGKRHSPEQIVRKLHQAEARLAAEATVPEVARELGISEATFHRWRNHHGAMSTSEAPQGTGVRERSPQEAPCREGTGHRHHKVGEQGKLLSPTRRRLPSSTFSSDWGTPSVGRVG
jgi:transposase-like protein